MRGSVLFAKNAAAGVLNRASQLRRCYGMESTLLLQHAKLLYSRSSEQCGTPAQKRYTGFEL